MEQLIQQHVAGATQAIETFVDAEIERLDNLEQNDITTIRQNRLKEMKQESKRREEWMQIGHGKYEELKDEKEFFEEQKKSERFICHFYRESTFRCKIVDKHLDILAKKHVESRFVKIDAEKVMWLCQRLKINVLPTLACVLKSKTKDYIVGFDDLGGVDDFPTEMLEWRLGASEMIYFTGDKPTTAKPTSKPRDKIFGYASKKKKGIQGNDDESDDSDMD